MVMQSLYQLMKLNRLMSLNRMVKNHRVKFLGILLLHNLKARHLVLGFDPIYACNLSCKMCHFSSEDFRKSQTKSGFKQEEIERIAELLFPKTLQIFLGCQAEPTLYKDFTSLVKLAKSYGVPFVRLVSNGQLICESDLNQLFNFGLDELVISVHGVRKETYETLMPRASYSGMHLYEVQ